MNLKGRVGVLEKNRLSNGLIGMISPDLPNVIALLKDLAVSIKLRSEVRKEKLSALIEVKISKLDDGFKFVFEHEKVSASELAPLFLCLHQEWVKEH